MTDQKIIEALIKGAVVTVSIDRHANVTAYDDLPPNIRDCLRASREGGAVHRENCPECLDDEADNILMDAASHRMDGHEITAMELEAEAQELRRVAAQKRFAK